MTQSSPPWLYIAPADSPAWYRGLADWLDRQPKNASSWIEGTTKSWLAAVGLIYLIGYVIWSFHAYQRGLGQIPALRAQYLVAGIIPLVSLGILALAVWGVLRFCTRQLTDRQIGNAVILALYILAVLLWVLLQSSYPSSWPQEFHGWLGYAFLGILVAGFASGFISRLVPRTGRVTRYSYSALLTLIAVSLFAVSITVYIRILYERIPEAFGGVSSHCEILYLEKASLAPELVPALARGSVGDDVTIVQTSDVRVLFVGSDNTRFRLKEDPSDHIYSIENDAIAASETCRD
jgi:hypothetical protein